MNRRSFAAGIFAAAAVTPATVDLWMNRVDARSPSPTNINQLEDAVKAVSSIVVGPTMYNTKGYGADWTGATDSATAIQNAINDAQNAGGGKVFIGNCKINSTLNITKGGVELIGRGTNAGAGGRLLWGGAAGADVVSILGLVSARIDKVKICDLIIDGNNVARYGLRTEKADVGSVYDVRLRNCVTAAGYLVDATGYKFYNVGITTTPAYGLVLDWGCGGFNWFGGQYSQGVAASKPAIVIQGVNNAIVIQGLEMDANAATFAGFGLVTGFDAKSSFASAPAGGAGAPSNVRFVDIQTNLYSPAPAPAQGADFLITGTATNPSQQVMLSNVRMSGGTVGTIAVRADFTNYLTIEHSRSVGHTAGAASTLDITDNATAPRMFFVESADGNRYTGSSTGLIDIRQVANAGFSVKGHVVSAGAAPSVAAGAQAGTGPPAPSMTAGSTDNAGRVAFGTGAGAAGGAMAAVTFSTPFVNAPNVIVVAENSATQGIGLYLASGSVTTAGFTISAATPASNQEGTTYVFHYIVIGH